MRWILIDRFTELDNGRYAKAIKNVTMGEDHIHDQYPAYPVMPQSLIIESMAQTGGILAGYSLNFQRSIFLAKIEKATFDKLVRPGDSMIIEAWIDDLRDEGCRVQTAVSVDEHTVASAHIMFVGMEHQSNGTSDSNDFIFAKELLSVLNIPTDGLQKDLSRSGS